MNTVTRVKPLVEGGILSSIAVLLSLLSVYIPVIGIALNLLTPLPIAILVVRHNIKTGLIASFVVAVLLAVLIHPLYGIKALIASNLTGVVLGWTLRERFGAEKIVIFGAGAETIAYVLSLLLGMVVAGINPITAIEEQNRMISQIAIQQFSQGAKNAAEIEQFKSMIDNVVRFFMIVVPVVIVIASFASAYINYWIARPVLRKMGYEVKDLAPLRLWDFSKYVFVGWFIGFAGYLASLHYFGAESLTHKFSLNVLFAFSTILFLQGLALISSYATKYNLSKIARFFVFFIIFLDARVAFVVVYLGIADMFFNFRHLERKG